MTLNYCFTIFDHSFGDKSLNFEAIYLQEVLFENLLMRKVDVSNDLIACAGNVIHF